MIPFIDDEGIFSSFSIYAFLAVAACGKLKKVNHEPRKMVVVTQYSIFILDAAML